MRQLNNVSSWRLGKVKNNVASGSIAAPTHDDGQDRPYTVLYTQGMTLFQSGLQYRASWEPAGSQLCK